LSSLPTSSSSASAPPLPFSCDLVAQSKHHVAFLCGLHRHGITFHPITETALHRYSRCWLPLVAASAPATAPPPSSFTTLQQPPPDPMPTQQYPPPNTKRLIPPPDIAWLWHCHRLAPAQYQAYCERHHGGHILDPNPPFSYQHPPEGTAAAPQTQQDEDASCFGCDDDPADNSDDDTVRNEEEEDAKISTQVAWRAMFPNVPFFLAPTATTATPPSKATEAGNWNGATSSSSRAIRTIVDGNNTNHNHHQKHNDRISSTRTTTMSLDGYDIGASARVQANFLWQVSGPCFADTNFLNEGVQNYYKFLKLKSNCSDNYLPLVPTYQCDLMWHTHMLYSTVLYNSDCRRIRGALFHHDDSLTDRSAGGKLDLAYAATCRLWQSTYGKGDYAVPGGMYRGEPPSAYYETDVWTPGVGYDAGDRVAMTIAKRTKTNFNRTTAMTGSTSTGVDINAKVVWEFRNDKDTTTGWTAFSSAHQHAFETEYQLWLASAIVTIESGRNSNDDSYTVNMRDMIQVNTQTTRQRAVRRIANSTTCNASVELPGGAATTWKFQTSNKRWRCYDLASMHALEVAYQKFLSTGRVQIQTELWLYEVDVVNMVQTNLDHDSTHQIRRRPLVAGRVDNAPVGSTPELPQVAASAQSRPWLDPETDPDAFRAANLRSRTDKSLNSNSFDSTAVFGRGTAGDGYYSLDTRDAWEILHKRLLRREQYTESELDGYECTNCLCLGCTPTARQILAKAELERKYEQLRHMAAYALAKSLAPSPDADVDEDVIKRQLDPEWLESKNKTTTTETPNHYVTFPFDYYTPFIHGAAGCGGGGSRDSGAGCGYDII
jgi:Glycine-rich domain-containing protein-like/WWE domain